jgi:hypothetical protein
MFDEHPDAGEPCSFYGTYIVPMTCDVRSNLREITNMEKKIMVVPERYRLNIGSDSLY